MFVTDDQHGVLCIIACYSPVSYTALQYPALVAKFQIWRKPPSQQRAEYLYTGNWDHLRAQHLVTSMGELYFLLYKSSHERWFGPSSTKHISLTVTFFGWDGDCRPGGR